MSSRRFLRLACGLVAALSIQAVRAELITINVDPNGTTSNLNVYGTTLTGGTATWPTRDWFRDYQFRLSTASGSATFDAFAVQLSVSRQNNTATNNTLRASLWTGDILSRPNPALADALTTVTIPNSSVPTSGYSSITLTGPAFSNAQTIGTTPSVFFFRIWAEGNGGNTGGFNTKMANSVGELQAITMADSSTMNGDVALDDENDGFNGNDTYDAIQEVPEPSAVALALAGFALAGGVAWRRRR
jgi:hypothetical protein